MLSSSATKSTARAFLVSVFTASGLFAAWSWQEPYATVLPTGDLAWAPAPFVFEAGQSVRYIDFESGRDTNDGLTKESSWKHHPWDRRATARSAVCKGVHTYVFKRGVDYRGAMSADESGEAGNPIRLTSDPTWGTGDAVICGSERITGWELGATHPDIPDALDAWFVDLEFAPRNVWMVEPDDTVVRIALARTPNWHVSDPDDIKSEWWSWDNPGKQWGDRVTLNGTESHLAVDTVHLTGPADYYEGATIWPEYGWVMGTPYPTPVIAYFPGKHALVFGGQWSSQAGSYHVPRHCRYYLEDKPHYLDEPGEFWFDKKKDGGRLYMRLPDDRDPNEARVEVGRRLNLIDSEGMSHVHVSGLAFRFTNVVWDLGAPPMRHKDVDPACVRLLGSGTDIVVANCRFENVHTAVRVKALGDDAVIDEVVIRDNDVRFTDHSAFMLHDGGAWGMEYPKGRLLGVKVLRNRLFQIGHRPSRFGQGHAIDIECAQTAEIAGNICDRLYGSGIFVFGSKRSAAKADRPLTRILIHHNKVTDSLLNNNDWGGIETWQGGPAYVYDNISGNPGGYKRWGEKLHPTTPGSSRFGHAYYMDGGYKQYFFNNIAWGKSKDPFDRLGNCSAFQEIHGYLATVFNNTVYNFVKGSRRQAPEAGRNKYLGNIWDGIGDMVFRHADPSKTKADPNAADAGEQKSEFHHESNAYANNVFHDVPEKFAVFEPSGAWHADIASFRQGLAARKSIGNVGDVVSEPPLRNPQGKDFRPTPVAVDKGVRVFVPWGLHATVGEWHFYHAGDDPAHIVDEHFYMAPYYVDRQDYHKLPMYPLHAVNIGAGDYVDGPLENWTQGALTLNGRDQYAVLTAEALGWAPTRKQPEIKNKPHDWIEFDVPKEIAPGKAFQAKVRLKGVEPGIKLRADLHWVRDNGRFGGMNAWGGEGHTVEGPGPYTFTITSKDKPGLSHFILTVWLTPTGGWKDQTKMAQYSIPPTAVMAPEGGYKTPAVTTGDFLVEAYFRTVRGATDGVLIEKMQDAGYSVCVNRAGGVTFAVAGGGGTASLDSSAKVNDGAWHHVVAEADRAAKTLTVYVDGKQDATGTGLGDASLANSADLYVGGTPNGRCLAGTFEFLRVALGTLADAKTTIGELYAWEFDGPAGRDWNGLPPADGRRDAGAVEAR